MQAHDYKVKKHNADYHWNRCVNCGATNTKVKHSGGTATCTAKAKCDTCNVEYGDLDTSNHDYSAAWVQTAEEHYYECSRCSDKKDKAAHSFGDDNSCDTCGYARTVTQPITPTPTPSTGGSEFTGDYNYPIIVDDIDGVAVDLSEEHAVAGDTVTITVTPDEGKQVRNVIVSDVDGEVIPVTKVGDNEYAFTMPEGKVNIVVTTKAVDYNTKIVLRIDSPYVTLNGDTFLNDAAPIVSAEGRTMLPIRVIAETFGADVDWNPELQKVTITKDGTAIEIFIGKYFAYVNGEIVKLDTAAFIKGGRTYLQVRFVSELLGCDVDWDAANQTVTIQGNKSK